MQLFKTSLFIITLFLIFSKNIFAAEAHAPHVHGEANLTIVNEGKKVQIEFMSPAYNIVGFEYLPKTIPEKKKINAGVKALKETSQLFVFKESANCKLVDTEVVNPFRSRKSSHRDFSATYQYECENVSQLSEITVELSTIFSNLHKVNVEWIVADKQGAIALTKEKNVVKF